MYEEPILMQLGDVETIVLGIITPGSDWDGTLVVGAFEFAADPEFE